MARTEYILFTGTPSLAKLGVLEDGLFFAYSIHDGNVVAYSGYRSDFIFLRGVRIENGCVQYGVMWDGEQFDARLRLGEDMTRSGFVVPLRPMPLCTTEPAKKLGSVVRLSLCSSCNRVCVAALATPLSECPACNSTNINLIAVPRKGAYASDEAVHR